MGTVLKPGLLYPDSNSFFRSAWTMLLSAYWHGLHPGYYLSFMTIPLCLAAEGYLESALRKHLSPRGQQAWDWVHWFLKMRAYDYMCMGFVLLTMGDTLRYWASIYYWIHFLALACLGLGLALGGAAPARGRQPPRPPPAKPGKSSGKSELCCSGLPASAVFAWEFCEPGCILLYPARIPCLARSLERIPPS